MIDNLIVKNSILKYLSGKKQRTETKYIAKDCGIEIRLCKVLCDEIIQDDYADFIYLHYSRGNQKAIAINEKGSLFIENGGYVAEHNHSLERNPKNVTIPPTKAHQTIKTILIGLFVTVLGGLILWYLTKLIVV